MFGLFSKKKQSPKEIKKEQQVYIENDFLIYNDHGYEESVDLKKLKYAYVQILGDTPYLFMFDYKQRYISTNQKGFSEVYLEISRLFEFNDETFFKVVNQDKEIKECVFKKHFEQNYGLLENFDGDYRKGFEVLYNPPIFVSWDTTYEEFKKLNIGHTYIDEFESTYFRIDYPVRIGSMTVERLEFYYEFGRENIAVQSYFASLYNENNTDKSYCELRDLWMKSIPVKIEEVGFEREDQKYVSFDMDSVYLSICYTYDSEFSYDDGSTSLMIDNRRDYSNILDKTKPVINASNSEIHVLKSRFSLIPDYRKYEFVKRTPDYILEMANKNNVLWKDLQNNNIGFTDGLQSVVFSIDEVECIYIQNVLPAKGGGYLELGIKTISGESIGIYYGELGSLEKDIEKIETVSEKKVIIPEPYYNC